MYLTGQHPVTPPIDQLGRVTHVALAFMSPGIFNDPTRTEWPLFTTVDQVRANFTKDTKVMIAIGGWGDTIGFSVAALTPETRRTFAENVARMVEATGADGIDVDWEYPGGNGEDYREVPNTDKAWEITAYPLLLGELRIALPNKIISAAVPGLRRDMVAFTHETVPRIMRHLDFLNVMTYDLMNRRDTVTKHHTGIQLSAGAVDAYINNGASPRDINLGFAFYTKYFKTDHEACASAESPVGCPTLLLEDPETGADLGRAGGFSWHDSVPSDVAESFERALEKGTYDESQGGYYFWDEEEDIWWTFDTADAIKRKFRTLVKGLGGVFAWGLGEDAPVFEHLTALNEALAEYPNGKKDEL
ncbi:glycoside hydrolase superfamily [Immersiella caudata]|uniref:chitinase n=1 Tax=Immersiella caudata TaxID=314043 RepID=A0AA39TN19_9PEZI|nr:glycoside hydrolase superfamily [Immersiella caudata]